MLAGACVTVAVRVCVPVWPHWPWHGEYADHCTWQLTGGHAAVRHVLLTKTRLVGHGVPLFDGYLVMVMVLVDTPVEPQGPEHGVHGPLVKRQLTGAGAVVVDVAVVVHAGNAHERDSRCNTGQAAPLLAGC